jgi:tetratricopeptide (TPR) repeat protein
VPPQSREAATVLHQLGMVAELRGDYEQALQLYRRSLAIEEELGSRGGMAISYHQFGMVAQCRGDQDQALEWYRRSLSIAEPLGDRAGIASTTSQMSGLLTEMVRPRRRWPTTSPASRPACKSAPPKFESICTGWADSATCSEPNGWRACCASIRHQAVTRLLEEFDARQE